MSRHRNEEPSGRAAGPGLVEFGDDRLDATQKAVRSAAFLNLLDMGRPTNTTEVSRRAETPVEVANQTIRMLAKQGSAHLDGDGDLLGIAGLSVEPTKHMIALPVGERWTWCALDAIGIVGALGAGTITSRASGSSVTVSFQDGRFHPEGLAIFLADGYGLTSSISQWCPLVDFFPNVEAADSWAREHDVSGRGVPVARLVATATDRWRTIIEHRQIDE